MTQDTENNTGLITPTSEEIKARRKRNIMLGLLLAAFMVFVFLTMLARAGAI